MTHRPGTMRDLSGRAARTLAAVVCVAFVGAPPAHTQSSPQPRLFVAPQGTDSGNCTQSAPCRTFDRAYHLAQPGDVVAVAPGTYPAQTVTADPAKYSPAVVFEPQDGDVRVAALTILGSYVEFDDLTIVGVWYVGNNSTNAPQSTQPTGVTLRDVNAADFFITGASNVSVLGGRIGPYVDNAAQIKSCDGCRYVPQHITIDGVTFHDFTRASSGVHMECLHVYPAQDLAIRNSRFFNCAIFDVFLANYGAGGDLRNITIENNVFDMPGSRAGALSQGYYPVSFEGFHRTITNVRIAYNSFASGSIPGFDSSATYTGIVVEANVGAMDQRFCSSGVTFAYNVWTSAKCGATDTTAPTGFVDPGHQDYRLRPNAAAIDHGDPNDHPVVDVAGLLRPTRWRSDAGAYQWETALVVLGKSIGAASIGERTSRVAHFYGHPADSGRVRVGSRTLERQVYAVRGGTLWVTSAAGTVVGIGTTSPYYETADSLGPRSAVARLRRSGRTSWVGCRRAYRRYYGGVAVYFVPRGGRAGATIGSISMTKSDGGC